MKILKSKLLYLIILISFIGISCSENVKDEKTYPDKVIKISDESASDMADKIRKGVAVEIADGLELSLWASDSIVNDPIAISVGDQGEIYYTQGSRLTNSEFDIRGHQDWMTASISFQSVEDRRAFIRKTFETDSKASMEFLKDLNEDGVRDWRDLTVEKEQVWVVSDQSDNGLADQSQLYIEDYHEEISDLANGVEYHDGEVYISVGPDLWRTKDTDGDGVANTSNSISHGFAVHIGFGAHGMSGVTMGPDGRIWWGIGDIGMNVIDKEGKQWKYPNRGVVVRSEKDGSNFEVFAMGVRNTHEFVFDKYGNLITVDNDGDHRGESERLVYLIDGSDTGWRINWQFGKYTDPKNNEYKVWMDERMSVPRWDGQAAYFLPPIQNYVNGPTGMVYNPGTALGPDWYDHFFIAEFRGTPGNSPVHAFTMKPDGAGFALDETQEIAKGLLPTGLDFGPEGALYFGDWINGWNTKKEGRIWKLDVPNGAETPIRKETKILVQADYSKKSLEELAALLGHQDMRIRSKAQFQLASRGTEGFAQLENSAKENSNQLARIHGLWGMSQMARKDKTLSEKIAPFLNDADPEIIAQAAKLIGDLKYKGSSKELIGLVSHELPRIQFFATEALGRTEDANGIPAILEMIKENDDVDTWLRVAGSIALGRINQSGPLVALTTSESRAQRIAAVVALRRMEDPSIAAFLEDKDEYIVAEAARGINDDFSIPEALPALANTLNDSRFTSEPLIRRAISANLRVGKLENINILKAYATNTAVPKDMRAEALAALGTWGSPSLHDRVDGRYRGEVSRDVKPAQESLSASIAALIKDESQDVKVAAIEATGRLNIGSASPLLFGLLQNDNSDKVREASLRMLEELEAPELEKGLEIALADKSNTVRSKALDLLPKSKIPEATVIRLFKKIFEEGTIEEQQASLGSLGEFQSSAAVITLKNILAKLSNGTLKEELKLDVIEAVEAQKNPELLQQLKLYQDAKSQDDPLAMYYETLEGGNKGKGQRTFYRNQAAQCTRCHAIFEYGGNAGPGLSGVADRLTKKQLLSSLITPSAEYGLGYEVATIDLNDGSSHTGIIAGRTDDTITIKLGKEDIRTIANADIKLYESIPSSMPIMKDVLSKMEIRDMIAFLSSLHDEESD